MARHRAPVTRADVSWSLVAILSAVAGALAILAGIGYETPVRQEQAMFMPAPSSSAASSTPRTASTSKAPRKTSAPATKRAVSTPKDQPGSTTVRYGNCSELREDYRSGVGAGHPAYRKGLDRDSDGWACELPGR